MSRVARNLAPDDACAPVSVQKCQERTRHWLLNGRELKVQILRTRKQGEHTSLGRACRAVVAFRSPLTSFDMRKTDGKASAAAGEDGEGEEKKTQPQKESKPKKGKKGQQQKPAAAAAAAQKPAADEDGDAAMDTAE